jgi:dihydroneopterin aldolase
MTDRSNVQPLRIADADQAIRHVFIRNLRLDAHIGAYRHEEGRAQPILVNIDLTVSEDAAPIGDRLEAVVDYAHVARGVREIVDQGHVKLVETLAEAIATFALADPRVRAVRVRIEKLKALRDADSVGVEIERISDRT